MRKLGIALMLVGVALLPACDKKSQPTVTTKETTEASNSSDTQKTQTIKTEAFSVRKGIVLIKGFSKIGTINGMGKVSVDAVELRDASNPKSQELGIRIEVVEYSRMGRESISFIDYDEIDSLIKGLDYIAKIDKTVTTMSDFEATYKTKSDFSITVFNDNKGKLSTAISSGRVGNASVYTSLNDLEKLKSLFVKAKQTLDVLKKEPIK